MPDMTPKTADELIKSIAKAEKLAKELQQELVNMDALAATYWTKRDNNKVPSWWLTKELRDLGGVVRGLLMSISLMSRVELTPIQKGKASGLKGSPSP